MQVQLDEPTLGPLVLGCDPYVVTSLQVGSPAVREVMRDRSLADGAYDDTRFLGARAVTVTLRLKNVAAGCTPPVPGVSVDMQTLIDRVVRYMSPRLRPLLSFQLPGSGEVRSMVVRGASWPVAIDGPKYPTLPLSFVCSTGEIFTGAGESECTTIQPSTEVEGGRVYDLTFNRTYPPSQVIGGRTVVNQGTAPAHWIASIFGAVTNPVLEVNGIRMSFDRNGGLVVNAGEFVQISTRERTALHNGNPATPVYDRMNFDEWAWADVLLAPGDNQVRFFGLDLSATAQVEMCWRSTWLA